MNGKLLLVVSAMLLVATVYTVFILSMNDKQVPGLQPALAQEKGSRGTRTNDQEKSDHDVFDGVQTFLMFIGYPRSGHTLIRSLIDAHPNAIVANELDVISKWQQWSTADKNKYFLFNQLYLNSIKTATIQHRYSYFVSGQWQGKYNNNLLVIGDKKGGKTTNQLKKLINVKALVEIEQVVEIPMKFLHVVRNPYDNIATMLVKALNKRDETDSGKKINDPSNLDIQITKYFILAERNNKLKDSLPGEVYEVHSAELIKQPQKTLLGICQFLNLTCDQRYIEDCSRIIFPEAKKTRYSVVWTAKQKELVRAKLQRVPFLQNYSFED